MKKLASKITAVLVAAGLMFPAGTIGNIDFGLTAFAEENTAEGYTNGFCDKYELKEDGSWGLIDENVNCTHTDCNGYQPATLNGSNYEIGNAGQLYWFADKVNNENATYGSANAVLTDNITVNEGVLDASGNLVSDTSGFRSWTPIGTSAENQFTGIFDGNDKTISGLYYNVTISGSIIVRAGLFGRNAGTIKNVSVKSSYFGLILSNAYCYFGGLCGFNIGTIENCYNEGTITVMGTSTELAELATVGGVSGSGNGTIKNSHNKGKVTVTASKESYVGGVKGCNTSTIENCSNTGEVSGIENVGGVCGYNYADSGSSKIESCSNTGTVSGTYSVGGVCGYNYATSGGTVTITNCYNTGTVSGTYPVGGVCGFHSPLGNNIAKIENSYSTGAVSGTSSVGGVCGAGYDDNISGITNCYYLSGTAEGGIGGADNEANNVVSKTAGEFGNGSVCYLLNGSTSTNPVWYQTLDSEAYPNLDSTNSASRTVYISAPCKSVYSNDENKSVEHTTDVDTTEEGVVQHKCTVCGDTHPIDFKVVDNTISVCCDLGSVTLTAPTENLTYDGTAKAATVEGELTGFDTPEILYKLKDSAEAATDTAPTNAGTYVASITYTDADSVNHSVSVEYTIDKATPGGDINRNINVVRGVGTFTEPVFTGVDGQPLGGGVKYGERDYDQLVEYLKTLSNVDIDCSYEFTPDDVNYNNVTGFISFYIYDVVFKVGNDDATAENAVTVRANPTYGDDWEDILTLNNGLKAVLFNSLNNALDDSEVTTGFSLDVTGSPNAGSQTYNVLFNGTVGGKTYTDHVVATGTVDVAKKELTVSAGDFKVSKVYDGTTGAGASTGDLTVSGLVGTDTVTITPTIGAYSSADIGTSNVTVTISLTDDSGNYTLGNTTVSVPAEITPRSIDPKCLVVGTYTYTGSPIIPKVIVQTGGALGGGQTKVYEKDKDYTIEVTNNINAGTGNVTFKPVSGGNYTFDEQTAYFTIDKATPNVTAPTAKTGLVYNGTAQELIDKGSTDFGTLLYSLDDTTYSTSIPTATNAGEYTVYYKVQGNDNVEDVAANNVSASIDRASVTVTAKDYTVKFGNPLPESLEYETDGLIGTDTLSSIGANVTIGYENAVTPSAIGNYIIVVSGEAATTNYNLTYNDGTLTIIEKPAQTITANDVTLSYGDTGKKIGAATSGDGAITYAVASGDDVIRVATDGTITALKAGTATVEITAAETFDYAKATKTITVTVNKKKVAVPTADATEYTYNGKAQTYGVVSTDDYTVTGGTQTDAGNYPITITLNNENFEWDGVLGTYTFIIKKAAVTITANSYTVKVGNTLPKFDYKVSGLVNNEALPITVSVSCSATDSNTAGKYPITVLGAAESTNYTFNYVDGTLTITEKDIQTITAADVTLTYGDAGKKIGATTNGDGAITYAVASGDDVIRVAADGTITALKAGTATVEITAAETDGYAAATKTVSVTVNKKKVAVPTADSTEYTYNGKAQTYGVVSTADYTVTGGTQTNAGTYPITITLNDGNFEWDGTLGTHTFVIKQAAVTITANSYTVNVGKALPTFDYKVTGLVNNEKLPITVIVSCTATDSSTAGTFPITVSGAADSTNYTFNYVNGTLTITEKDIQTITAADVTLTYGDAGKKIGATTNGDGTISYSAKTGSDVITVAADGTIKALKSGTATVEITAAETDAYEQATTTVTVTVNKAAVTIKADDKTVYQNAALPTFTYSVTGLANGDKLSFTPVLTCEATTTSTVGTYAITVTIEITEDECYTYTTTNGTLTVKKKSSGGGGGGGYRPTTPTEPNNPSIGGSAKSWSDVAADLGKLTNGSETTIELNGNTTLPTPVIKAIADKDSKVTFVINSVFSWVVDGAEITTPVAIDLTLIKTASTKSDTLRGIEGTQFKINGTNIPTDLMIAFKKEHEGKFANLYKVVDGKLVFVTCAKLGEDGKVILPDVVEKGDYVAMLCEFSDRLGDMDNDGVMNAKDAAAILKDIVEIEPGKNPLMADFNGDGKVNAMDAAAILKRIVGLA